MIFETETVVEDILCPECAEEGVLQSIGKELGASFYFYCETCSQIFVVRPVLE